MSIYFRRSFQRAFGTFPLNGKKLTEALSTAIDTGYRAFDTAQMYGNETTVGAALADSGIPSAEFCVTTKIMPANCTAEKLLPSVEGSLRRLRLDKVDVLLLHWPPADGNIGPPLESLLQARERSLARHIGVSNFTVRMMHEAKSIAGPGLATNQVEFHPLLNQDILLGASAETGIPLSAYCSVARGEVFRLPDFAEIGSSYGKSAGQVVLRWILQKGVSVNTMSANPANIRVNFDVMDFTLSCVDMARIDKLTLRNQRIVTKSLMPTAPDWD